jgi:hypothetical protein
MAVFSNIQSFELRGPFSRMIAVAAETLAVAWMLLAFTFWLSMALLLV